MAIRTFNHVLECKNTVFQAFSVKIARMEKSQGIKLFKLSSSEDSVTTRFYVQCSSATHNYLEGYIDALDSIHNISAVIWSNE